MIAALFQVHHYVDKRNLVATTFRFQGIVVPCQDELVVFPERKHRIVIIAVIKTSQHSLTNTEEHKSPCLHFQKPPLQAKFHAVSTNQICGGAWRVEQQLDSDKMAVPSNATTELTSSKRSVCLVHPFLKDRSKVVSLSEKS